jgi:regulator of replication initiation timing
MERLVEIRELKGKVADLETEIHELLEENERLRKAGDRLHDALVITTKYGDDLHPSIWNWDKAKEVQS